MILKGLGYFAGSIAAGMFVSDTFARKVERNLV